jgi:hypothetical protein
VLKSLGGLAIAAAAAVYLGPTEKVILGSTSTKMDLG